MKEVKVKGILVKARREVNPFNGVGKLNISLAEVKAVPKEVKAAYKGVDEKFIPRWVKNFEGYVNLSTNYELKVFDFDGVFNSIEKAMAGGVKFIGATVEVTLTIKEGRVYPKDITVIERK